MATAVDLKSDITPHRDRPMHGVRPLFAFPSHAPSTPVSSLLPHGAARERVTSVAMLRFVTLVVFGPLSLHTSALPRAYVVG